VLTRYRDPAGAEHLLLLLRRPTEGALLLDRSARAVLVVAELAAGEGERQARAVLRDWPGDPRMPQHSPPVEGYLRRAARSEGRLCRWLVPEDLVPSVTDEPERRAA
jgi:hypothetical protein